MQYAILTFLEHNSKYIILLCWILRKLTLNMMYLWDSKYKAAKTNNCSFTVFHCAGVGGHVLKRVLLVCENPPEF